MSSLVVVPTYNEVANLEPLADRIMGLPGFRLMVVDDNSPDGTGELAERLGSEHRGRVEVLHRPGKLGLGTAYLAAFRIGLERGYQYIFQMDADFSHDPADLPRLRGELRRGADLVIGSRYITGAGTAGWPLWRRMMSRAGSLYARLLLGLRIHDLTGGFRGWRRQTLARLGLDAVQSEGFAFQVEMAYRCALSGGRIREIPIVFAERRHGASKMSLAIFVEAAITVWRLRLQEMALPPPVRERLVGRG